MTTETNAEQLENIKRICAEHLIREDGTAAIAVTELKFLVEQAERAQELEVWEETARNYFGENVKLRGALKEIIECSDIEIAVQEIARQALKGTTKDGGHEGKSI